MKWMHVRSGLAMLDEFKLWCTDWIDPDKHSIIKYAFTSECDFKYGPRTTLYEPS